MNFKVKITCKCGCEFEIRSGKHDIQNGFTCQSCGRNLPSDVAKSLSLGLEYLGEIPGTIPEGDPFLSLDGYYHFEVVPEELPF